MPFVYRDATIADLDHIEATFPAIGWSKPAGYFPSLISAAGKGDLRFLIATTEAGQFAGFLKVIWRPNYPHYRDNNIPEIQDLNVLPRYRRQGVASELVALAESIVAEKYDQIGIGFGLYADYGAAQRMYVQRGYVPIGDGAFSHDTPIIPGETVPVDDGLVLCMVKQLRLSSEQIAREWPALYFREGLIRLHYPVRTPAGHPVDVISKNNGGGTQVHLISRQSLEIYFELAVYPELEIADAWQRFLKPLRNSTDLSVSEIIPGELAGRAVEQCLITFPNKRRLVSFFMVSGEVCRLIYNPESALNLTVLETVTFAVDYKYL